MSVLLYVCGYVAKKIIDVTSCDLCCNVFGKKNVMLEIDVDSQLDYFNLCNRGGLIYPSNLLFSVVQYCYSIFNISINTIESEFIVLFNQKDTLLGVMSKFVDTIEYFEDDFVTCSCGNDRYLLIVKCLSCFINVLLNNYRKIKSSDVRKN